MEFIPREQIDENYEFTADVEEIDLANQRLTELPQQLSTCQQLHKLTLRLNQLTAEAIGKHLKQWFDTTLRELDLYENRIETLEFTVVEWPSKLTSLDLSFNPIRTVPHSALQSTHQLTDLYLVNCKIHDLSQCHFPASLTQLELGSNRIRVIENLNPLKQLKQLWLGRNKITELKNLDELKCLELLSIQSNRLTSLSDTCLVHLTSLRELYLSHNGLTSLEGIQLCKQLSVLDVAGNRLTSIEEVVLSLKQLHELWANDNDITESIHSISLKLSQLTELQTLYLENNPSSKELNPLQYKQLLIARIPTLTQLDSTDIAR